MRTVRTFLLLLLALPFNGTGQNKIISNDSIVLVENVLHSVSKKTNIAIIPGPVYGVSQKVGFAVLPMVVYNLKKSDTLSPPSSSAVMLYFDFYGSWAVAFKQSLYWNQNKWRAFAGGGYGDLRLKFFGIGNDTNIISNDDSNYVWTRLQSTDFSATCFRKIYRGLYGGIEYRFNISEYQGTDSISAAMLEQAGVRTDQFNESMFIPTFVWDNRNNIYWTEAGYYASIYLQMANKVFSSSNDYGVMAGWANGYHRLFRNSSKMILAWHVYVQRGWGDLPYTRLTTFGRVDEATGYTRGKYVNSSEASIQAELRYEVWKFISCGGYAGTGKVFPSFGVFGQSVWLHFGGARLYLNIIPSRNIRLRLDMALARKDWGFYVGIGQAF